MQYFVQLQTAYFAEQVLQIGCTGLFQPLHAAESLQQHFTCLGAYAGQVVEDGACLPFAAFVAVEGDGEAVYLVLHA